MSDNIKRLNDIAAGVRLYGAPDPALLARRIEAAAEELRAEVAAMRALLDRVVTEVGRTITSELRADIDTARAGGAPRITVHGGDSALLQELRAARAAGEPTSCPHGVPHRWPCEVCDAARAAGEKT